MAKEISKKKLLKENKVIKELKQIQSNSLIMFVKLHNLHWNTKGGDFYPIHKLTEELYEEMSKLYDDTAEKILQKSGQTVVTTKNLLKISKIKELKQNRFKRKDVFRTILQDFKYLRKNFKDLSKRASKEGDNSIISFADQNIEKIEKNIWMLNQSLEK